MAPSKWCCHSHNRSASPDGPNIRHLILSKRALRDMPSSIHTPSYDESDIDLSFLGPRRLSDDSGILPDPRDLTGDASPTTTTNPGTLTPAGMARKLRQRLSKDSTTFKVKRQQRRLQKKPSQKLRSKESTIDLDDLVGLHLATRTPSRGGYDADANLLTDAGLLATLEERPVTIGHRNARMITPPPTQQRSHLPRGVGGRSPLVEVHRVSSSEESSDDTAPRTSTSTYPFGTPRTPYTEDVTGEVTTETISSLESSKDVSLGPFDIVADFTEVSQMPSELQVPYTLNRLSLGAFSQSSLHLKNALMRVDSTLTEIPDLAAHMSMEHDSNEDPLKAVNSQVYARLDKTLRTSAPHLQDMRISQHLRSLSSFSEDQVVADMPVDVIHEPYDIEASATKPQQETSSEFCNDTATPSRMGSRQDELTALERSAKQLSLDIPELPGDADAVSLSKLITAATKRRYDLYVQSHRDSKMFDGSADPLLAPPPAIRARSRGSSVTENIEETAAVWEKAFAGYQMEQLERGKKRRSGSTSRSSRLRAASYEEHLMQDNDSSARHVSLSVDHTSTPGDFSAGRSPSHTPLPRQTASQDAVRAKSVGPMDEDLDVPSITLTKPERLSEVVIGPTTPSRKQYSAWARFPSEDREERNASAGISDNVLTRDFATPSSSPGPLVDSELEASPKKKKRGSALKHKLADLPSVFKGRSFRMRSTGHRSSIAPGGKLEYPELEILPGSESHDISVMEAWSGAMSSGGNARRDFSFDSSRHGDPTLNSLAGSSHYGSMPGSPPASLTSNRRNRPTAAEMAEYYVQYVGPGQGQEYARRRGTDLISPLDGMSTETLPLPLAKQPRKSSSLLSLRRSPGSKSMPSTLKVKFRGSSTRTNERPATLPRQRIEKLASTEGLRRSTQDLNTMLEKSAMLEAEKAIRAAENW